MQFARVAANACLFALASFPLVAGSAEAWVDRVDKRLDHIRPAKQKLDLIAWAPSLRQAVAAARSTNRPVFLFTHDGYINIGRC